MANTLFDSFPPELKTIATRPLFALQLEVAPPINIGATPGVDRRIGVITGGRFQGDKLAGKVLSGGSDWLGVRSDGAWTLNVRVALETDAGDLIGMTYQGVRFGPPEILARIGRGESVNPTDYYFRINPLFETASERLGWLNRIVAVGTGHRLATGPIYSVFEVL